MKTLGMLRDGKDARIYLTGGQSFFVRMENGGGLSMSEDSGFCNAVFTPGKGIQYLGALFRILPDPDYPTLLRLDGESGPVARFREDHIELFAPAIDASFLLFAAWAIQATRKKLLESTWFGD